MTPDSNVFRFDDSGLRNLLKMMESKHFVRVGIFGGSHKTAVKKKSGKGRKAGKQDSGMTNAEVGFLMEYGRPKMEGSPKIPARSWLRMPLMTKMNEIVKDAAKPFLESANSGDSTKFLKAIGISAEAWIQRAFASGGFGGWEPNAPSTIAAKGSSAPLIDTGQLRRSVASQVI